MRLKIYENLPQEVAGLFREGGHDAVTVSEQGMGGAKDGALFERCRSEGRVLVTLDLDFTNIQAYPPATAPGILVLRLSRQDKPSVLEMVRRVMPVLKMASIARSLWILEDDRIRIRR